MIRVGLLGPGGRTGLHVAQVLETEFAKEAKLEAPVGRGDSLDKLWACDVVIDFSSPSAMGAIAGQAIQRGGKLPAFVIGSTGWKQEELKTVQALGEKTLVLMASNFSTGVLAVMEILKDAAPLLKKLGYTPVMVEAHHRHKKDAPSGTALSLAKVITGGDPNSMQIHAVRAGEVIGDHEVTFYGQADKIVLGHFAQDRTIFARGAIETALWLARRRNLGHSPSGILNMDAYFQDIKTQS